MVVTVWRNAGGHTQLANGNQLRYRMARTGDLPRLTVHPAMD